MENLKVYVKNEAESEEAQELLFELGYDYYFAGKTICNTNLGLVTANEDGLMAAIEIDGFDYKEVTIQQLKDMVVLKRNSVEDATHYYGGSKYYLTDSEFYQYSEGKWVNIDEYVDGMTFNEIEKEGEVKMKEYLELQEDGSYAIVLAYRKEGNGWIEVPEGAEIFLLDKSFGEDTIYFVKHDGEVFHEYYISGTNISHNTWIKGTLKELHNGMVEVLWKRNRTITPNTSIQNKLKPKNGEVKMKEFLNPEQGYSLVKCCVGETPIPKSLIEIPEGAEIAVESWFKNDVIFYKDNGECQFDEKWITCNVEDKNGLIHTNLKTFLEWGEGNKIVWQRSEINKDIDKGLSIKEKLKFIEKWLNGEKIQYILGIETDKTQWHNFTEGAMQYIKRPDIKFREAPEYVTINGIEFKNVKSLLKHVKNNFDLEDGE